MSFPRIFRRFSILYFKGRRKKTPWKQGKNALKGTEFYYAISVKFFMVITQQR